MAAILHVYAGGLIYVKKKKNEKFLFQKENGNTFTLLIIVLEKCVQKEHSTTMWGLAKSPLLMSMWTKIAEIFSISCQPKTLSHKIECGSNIQIMFRNGMRSRKFGEIWGRQRVR